MHRNKSVNVHEFAMVPRADIPRASFNIQKSHKTTFNAGGLYPIYCEEILPGDTFKVKMTAFARMATPIFPIMDNMYLESFFFFVPNRIVWDNWTRFMGERNGPSDVVSDYVIPTITSPAGGFPVGSIYDYFGLPTAGQVGPAGIAIINALPLRGYNLIYNEWFKDQNLIDDMIQTSGDGPDAEGAYFIVNRGKRHDYFTSCLPWPQKGGSVTMPLGNTAPIRSSGLPVMLSNQNGVGPFVPSSININNATAGDALTINTTIGGGGPNNLATFGANGTPVNSLFADLSAASAATINQLRQSFQIQKLLKRDARGGTRYTEIVRAHFGVISPDARLQRPEYLGGGSTPVTINPVAQTSGTGGEGETTPLGTLSAIGTVLAHGHGFTQSFTEHGFVIGIVGVRADLTYQQGLRRMWSRSTRYDYYFPAFAMLGEQAVLSKEIYFDGSADDTNVFGYQERWAEYRYSPSMVTGLFRSTSPGTLDPWHLAQNFTTRPTLSAAFIGENPPLERIIAVGAEAGGAQFIFDSFFDMRVARPMPLYSVPGLIDHF